MHTPCRRLMMAMLASLALLAHSAHTAAGDTGADQVRADLLPGPVTAPAARSIPLLRVSPGIAPRVTDGIGVFDARVDLLDDDDGDGYYSEIAVAFDADSVYGGFVDVMAEISLVNASGLRWSLLSTPDFRISGNSALDARYYRVSIGDLPVGSYKLRVELYDACCYRLLDVLESAAYPDLRLESSWWDSDPGCCYSDAGEIYVSEETHGGSVGIWPLLALLLVGWHHRSTERRTRRDRRVEVGHAGS